MSDNNEPVVYYGGPVSGTMESGCIPCGHVAWEWLVKFWASKGLKPYVDDEADE